jgi:2-polyprenyl-3-methyl-5-hydroxy-6-metoxy-1,4-benzoquinol methylase
MSKLDKTLIETVEKYHWYQSIPLSEDYRTPGETGDAEQCKLQMMQLPEDLTGKTVLDIGCNEGFFAFEAERRGADRVVAIDKSPEAKEKLQLIKSILNSRIEFLKADLYTLDPSEIGQFDLVFFLSVFHHLRYPFLALDKIAALTRECCIFEFVEAIPKKDEGQAVLVRKLSKKGHLHMLPTRSLTMEILTRAGFTDIEILGTHRRHKVGPERKVPGFKEQRVLLKAFRPKPGASTA